ncbi:hypothetical protein SUGI_0504050 [Cryptomeria japonica]|uniref:uncharacterized protein LOC131034841 n=1 Tax=Cryptomeria japonica TaxID=3369 RepID=UPI002408A71D|nr:uncharacterized protein LOC131034841 [Cryptomeria japonica]GLJ26234.1 hypothetical protein SUGI_0504050 [Cryptomeria japonica]
MVGLQLSSAWAAPGFPLCLSGMTISSLGSSCHPQSRLQQVSLVESEIASIDSVFFNIRLCENEDQSTASAGSLGQETIIKRPRLALTLEMVEHEHRREAIRKQRSNDRIESNNLAEDTSFTDQNSISLQDVIKTVTEDPDLELDNSHTCAKAA